MGVCDDRCTELYKLDVAAAAAPDYGCCSGGSGDAERSGCSGCCLEILALF